MSLFKGAGVALITPFNEDNSVNYEMLRTLVKRQIDGGTDAIIVCGTTGEPATMTEEEKLSVIKCVVDETAGQIPVIAALISQCPHLQYLTTNVFLIAPAKRVENLHLSTLYGHACFSLSCPCGRTMFEFILVLSSYFAVFFVSVTGVTS